MRAPMSVPERPRLADHVLPRRHVVDGIEHVVLFDQRTGGVVRLGPREWGVVEAADGTRDLEGIRLAARRAGAHANATDIAELLTSLDRVGFIAGPRPTATPSAEPRVVIEPTTASDRPLEPLPDFGLRCDRSGACCRVYATVLMTRAEAERARTLLPEHRAGPVPHARFFLPVAGSEPTELVAPTARDGACGYLHDDGRCAVHVAGGMLAKPAGCHVFPVMFVDDGTSVRVSVKTECACVLDGGVVPGGDPICDPGWRTAWDLPPHVVVTQLPAELAIREGVTIARDQARAWVDAWLARPAPRDAAPGVWAMADALEQHDTAAALHAWSSPPPVRPEDVVPFVHALHARASRRAAEDTAWRSEHDHVRITTTWIAATTLLLREPEVLAELLAAEPGDPAQDAFYVRAAAFGYAVFDRPLVTSLRDLAVRLWTSRAMALLVPPELHAAPSHRRPLARLDAVLRAYGLRNYVVDDVVDDHHV